MREVLAVVLAIGFMIPVLAEEFYVVRNSTTKKCIVVDKRPTTTTITVVSDGTVYKTRTEADAAMK